MKTSLIAVLILTSSIAGATPPQWQIIPKESQLTFTATQNGAPIKGEFKVFSGTILVDPLDLKSSSIDIIVDVASVYAAYPELRETLISADWFSSKLFPKAEFKSNQIEKNGEKTYLAKGKLTIRDKSVPVTLSFTGDQSSATKGMVTGTTTIKRSQFGVGQGEWSQTNEIKDDVVVNFKVVAVKKE